MVFLDCFQLYFSLKFLEMDLRLLDTLEDVICLLSGDFWSWLGFKKSQLRCDLLLSRWLGARHLLLVKNFESFSISDAFRVHSLVISVINLILFELFLFNQLERALQRECIFFLDYVFLTNQFPLTFQSGSYLRIGLYMLFTKGNDTCVYTVPKRCQSSCPRQWVENWAVSSPTSFCLLGWWCLCSLTSDRHMIQQVKLMRVIT